MHPAKVTMSLQESATPCYRCTTWAVLKHEQIVPVMLVLYHLQQTCRIHAADWSIMR
jgi:hypothetical protein